MLLVTTNFRTGPSLSSQRFLVANWRLQQQLYPRSHLTNPLFQASQLVLTGLPQVLSLAWKIKALAVHVGPSHLVVLLKVLNKLPRVYLNPSLSNSSLTALRLALVAVVAGNLELSLTLKQASQNSGTLTHTLVFKEHANITQLLPPILN